MQASTATPHRGRALSPGAATSALRVATKSTMSSAIAMPWIVRSPPLGPLARRRAFAPVVLLVVTALTYATPRTRRPDLYDDGLMSGVANDLERAFLHLDFGRACNWPGCPDIHGVWSRGAMWDLWLLGGA